MFNYTIPGKARRQTNTKGTEGRKQTSAADLIILMRNLES